MKIKSKLDKIINKKIIGALLIALLVAMVGLLVSVNSREDKHITNYQIKQSGDNIKLSWNKFNGKGVNYVLNATISDEKGNDKNTNTETIDPITTDEEAYTFYNVQPDTVYTVSIEGTTSDGETIPGATKSISVNSEEFPTKIKDFKVKLEYQDNSTALISWKAVRNADYYVLEKYSKPRDKFMFHLKCSAHDIESGKISKDIARMTGRYRVRAVAELGEEKLESYSNEFEIESTIANAKTYSSITQVQRLGYDDVEKVGNIKVDGYHSTQSISFTGEYYVAVSVNKSGGEAMLGVLSRDGTDFYTKEAGFLGHANGCAYSPDTNHIYVLNTPSHGGSKSLTIFDADTFEEEKTISLFTSPSGIAYDEASFQYYLSGGNHVDIADHNFNKIRRIQKLRKGRPQDTGAYNGVILSCTWLGSDNSYIDMYRASDGAYLGSIRAGFGEIESMCVDDGHFVLLMSHGDVYRTKKRINIG